MRRITRAEAICLKARPFRESSRLVTLFTTERGLVTCIARGARRPRSKFGAALDLFARSRVIYYHRDNRTLFTLSDAELVHSSHGLALDPARFLAAEQTAEFCLRVLHPHDPNPQLYHLLVTYLSTIESTLSAPLDDGRQPAIAESPYPLLVCSFLLKAASFLGFRPELSRCVVCRRPAGSRAACFDPARGGLLCTRCAGAEPGLALLQPADIATLVRLLYTPAAELPASASGSRSESVLPLVIGFLGHHFDRLVLNSFRRFAGLP
jgi:DNA repair protein RecO (recombination protein O)